MIKILIQTCLALLAFAWQDKSYELDDKNFDEVVMQSEDIWIFEYYDPMDEDDRDFQSDWARVTTEFEGLIKFGKIDI